MGFRPEKLTIGENPNVSFKVSVLTIEPTGADTLIAARIGKNDISIVVKERLDVASGKEISVSLREEGYHFFAVESGLCISA